MKNYKEENVVIVGLGVTGLSCVYFFLRRGIIPRVMDTRLIPPNLNRLPPEVPRCLGFLHIPWLFEATLIVTSPGISLSHPALAAVSSSGIPIVGDIELFAHEVSAPVIAITGSNGKSTVIHMLEKMIGVNWNVGVGGNTGVPALNLLDLPFEIYLLELSSFQLETTHNLKLTAATVLNITEDHMNRYPHGFQQYRTTKLKIYKNAMICIVNAEDIFTLPINKNNSRYISFGRKQGDYFLKQHKGQIWLMAYGEQILNTAELRIVGQHNYMNALAALAIADAVGISRESSLSGLLQCQGLAHRFELIHEQSGVRWINDSKATNVGSTLAALNGVEVTGTLHLIMGGDSKCADLTPLIPWLKNTKIHLYCFGQDRKRLSALRLDATTLTKTLEEIMYIVGSRVRQGDVVLLSPGCASLDQFTNFEARGQVFSQLAREVSR
ncbi:UDP-N-acetylmuramoylalanine--D-glutamate ligase [secondary endosymbiont of Heteropsylla cubana]|uniref:UDP-N-acetylmuramoylalanine--D-glutamate ligase n=1 Tax=secondary endosymbiont of Heteropsylla cubana TaxID=134287 RepID=J3TGR4_9ENTR|nr:UDP-N-acetylmuramoyl-L-alanine--D-glutamate ligase [secondary endosymbiont of Heteropsylla cubana]AFP85692.1 UDP-N-acetylmuramoylalanine--D-glutamate ligase [secondary endosymbiont of Heteropsylla cubana]